MLLLLYGYKGVPMPQVLDRVLETTTTGGLGTQSLAGAVQDYQSFSTAYGANASVYYYMEDGTNWECGIGMFVNGTNSLARTTVTASSAGGAKVNFPAGTIRVANTLTARAITDMLAQLNNTSKVVASNVALGTQAASQSGYTYTTLSAICARGIVSKFLVTFDKAGLVDLVVRGAANDAGSLYLQALGIGSLTYEMSLPFFYENDSSLQEFYVGWRNGGSAAVTATLTALRAERFA